MLVTPVFGGEIAIQYAVRSTANLVHRWSSRFRYYMAHYVSDAGDTSVLNAINDNNPPAQCTDECTDEDQTFVPGYFSTSLQLGTGKFWYIFTSTAV